MRGSVFSENSLGRVKELRAVVLGFLGEKELGLNKSMDNNINLVELFRWYKETKHVIYFPKFIPPE